MRLQKLLFASMAFCYVGFAQEQRPSLLPLSDDPEFSFILNEALALANNGAASTAEVLRAAQQIVSGDVESWYREFKFLADSIHDKAVKINKSRYPVSARDAFFRSATYYRMSEFFLRQNLNDSRIYTTWDAALADFDEAIGLLPIPGKRHTIPTANFSIPTVFYKATGDYCGKKRPTLVAFNGYDGSQEELYHSAGRAANERGYNFVTFEGPGQPTVRRQQGLGFIPEWWLTTTPVVDYLATRDDVDMDKLALLGVSFGGSLAPRAASREHRFKAVMSIDGMVDFQRIVLDQLGELELVFEKGDKATFDSYMLGIKRNSSTPTQTRWLIGQSLWAFDTDSPFDWLTQLREYKVDKSVMDKVEAKVLVAEGEDDAFVPGQAVEELELSGSKGTYIMFKSNLGAGEHCQLGAEAQLTQVMYDWLADVFDGREIPHNLTDQVL